MDMRQIEIKQYPQRPAFLTAVIWVENDPCLKPGLIISLEDELERWEIIRVYDRIVEKKSSL